MQNNNYNSQDYSGGFPTTPVPPYTPPPPPPPLNSPVFSSTGGSGNDLNQQLVTQMSGNMKFVGIWYIIAGVIYSLTCIGALIGVPVIFAGIRIREAAEAFKQFSQSGMQDKNTLITAFEKQNKYFYILKVLIIIVIVLAILEILFFIGMFIFMPSSNRYFNL
jgi:hypothetical protein